MVLIPATTKEPHRQLEGNNNNKQATKPRPKQTLKRHKKSSQVSLPSNWKSL